MFRRSKNKSEKNYSEITLRLPKSHYNDLKEDSFCSAEAIQFSNNRIGDSSPDTDISDDDKKKRGNSNRLSRKRNAEASSKPETRETYCECNISEISNLESKIRDVAKSKEESKSKSTLKKENNEVQQQKKSSSTDCDRKLQETGSSQYEVQEKKRKFNLQSTSNKIASYVFYRYHPSSTSSNKKKSRSAKKNAYKNYDSKLQETESIKDLNNIVSKCTSSEPVNNSSRGNAKIDGKNQNNLKSSKTKCIYADNNKKQKSKMIAASLDKRGFTDNKQCDIKKSSSNEEENKLVNLVNADGDITYRACRSRERKTSRNISSGSNTRSDSSKSGIESKSTSKNASMDRASSDTYICCGRSPPDKPIESKRWCSDTSCIIGSNDRRNSRCIKRKRNSSQNRKSSSPAVDNTNHTILDERRRSRSRDSRRNLSRKNNVNSMGDDKNLQKLTSKSNLTYSNITPNVYYATKQNCPKKVKTPPRETSRCSSSRKVKPQTKSRGTEYTEPRYYTMTECFITHSIPDSSSDDMFQKLANLAKRIKSVEETSCKCQLKSCAMQTNPSITRDAQGTNMCTRCTSTCDTLPQKKSTCKSRTQLDTFCCFKNQAISNKKNSSVYKKEETRSATNPPNMILDVHDCSVVILTGQEHSRASAEEVARNQILCKRSCSVQTINSTRSSIARNKCSAEEVEQDKIQYKKICFVPATNSMSSNTAEDAKNASVSTEDEIQRSVDATNSLPVEIVKGENDASVSAEEAEVDETQLNESSSVESDDIQPEPSSSFDATNSLPSEIGKGKNDASVSAEEAESEKIQSKQSSSADATKSLPSEIGKGENDASVSAEEAESEKIFNNSLPSKIVKCKNCTFVEEIESDGIQCKQSSSTDASNYLCSILNDEKNESVFAVYKKTCSVQTNPTY